MPGPEHPRGADLLSEGRALSRDWRVGPSAFLTHVGFRSERDYKLAAMAGGRVTSHAQIGWRDPAKSIRAYREIWETCDKAGHRVDRYGLCLDWSMALPRAIRDKGQRGTGMILRGPEDFVALANAAPVAAHFGDFVLGFPAALENTQAALAAGATAIGNLGQYFTFRVPGHDDDVAATAATVTALGLIAAQDVPVMVHSNIDDGFAAQFTDLANALGMILVERDIVTGLVGAEIGHAFGHHFSDPLARMAFQRALAEEGASPGTMVYGNTTSYRGDPAQNWASLASYLMVDALGQRLTPSGHAINPVPVTENERIPEIGEVIEAQLFAGRLIEQSAGWPGLIDGAAVDRLTATLRDGAGRFRRALWAGLAERGVECSDVFAVLLALRRMGGRRIEAEFGAGLPDVRAMGGRVPVVPATILSEIAEMSHAALAVADPALRPQVSGMRVLVATSDVHEHGKMLLDEMLRQLGAEALDGGTSTDPGPLADRAAELRPDAIAISTYNGVALAYYQALRNGLAARGLDLPVLIGGRLNQIPEGSNSSLPMDVGDRLAAEGAVVCRAAADLLPALAGLRRSGGGATRHP
ncbi:cobalamin-dependent protein [Tabrizicola sp.]|uniref:cobalamin-dependent protein n=1 Tax=Tabrizicola sp. TaxID=2005166 RepID=UPI002FDCB797